MFRALVSFTARSSTRSYATEHFYYRPHTPVSGRAAPAALKKGKAYKPHKKVTRALRRAGITPDHKKKRSEPDLRRITLGRTIARLLHNHVAYGIHARPDGFVKVSDLLIRDELSTVNQSMLETVVKYDAPQRFELAYQAPGSWLVRATPYHYRGPLGNYYRPVEPLDHVHVALWEATEDNWSTVIRFRGIPRHDCGHIRFTRYIPHFRLPKDLPGGTTTKPNIQVLTRVLILINVRGAMKAGIKFYLAKNGDLLTPGDQSGVLPTTFFQRVLLDQVATEIWEFNKLPPPANPSLQTETLPPRLTAPEPVLTRHGVQVDTAVPQIHWTARTNTLAGTPLSKSQIEHLAGGDALDGHSLSDLTSQKRDAPPVKLVEKPELYEKSELELV